MGLHSCRGRFLRRAGSLVATTSLTAFVPSLLLAQQPAPSAQAAAPAVEDELEEVIITGTSVGRASMDTPLAATTVDEDRLAMYTSNSQADILNLVPTIKAEGGGGEVAANVFIKGLPSGGQYQFTPLMYDGIPVFSAFGLNSSAFDVYYRNDIGIERLEFVRGGISNLFGPGSVAGLINYISKTGGESSEAKFQLEAAEDNRIRGDFFVGGPLADGAWKYAVSGFYRTDDGPIVTGNDTKGFQLRGNLKRDFADDSGSLTIYAQYIDDQAQFFLPFPLSGTTRERVAGADGRRVYSVQTSQVAGLGFAVPGGAFTTSITDGVISEGGSLALVFDKQIGGGWSIDSKLKFADYEHSFDFFLDGDGVINRPETLAGYLANRSLVGTGMFTYVDDGSAVAATTLLFPNRFIDRDRPATDATAEFNLTKSATLGSFEHDFTIGAFWGNADAKDFNVTTGYLADFRNEARLVNLTVTGPTGATTVISRNGLYDAGIGYVNNQHEVTRYALYVADQMESDRWIFDIGARFEKLEGDISRERTATSITDATTPSLSTALRNVVWGNGSFAEVDVDTDEWALATGVLYKLTDSVNLYANAARGYFFPEIRAVQINALGLPQSYTAEIIEQAEVGMKFDVGRVSGTASALYTELNDRRAVNFVNDGQGGVIERVNIVSTESYGVEATFNIRLNDRFSIDGNATYQEHEYTKFDTTPTNVGNELVRQPNVLWNLGLFYDDGRIDAAIFNTYTGSTFTNEANLIALESYNIARADIGYSFEWGDTKARVGFDVYNLFDDDGITEGSPRQDTAQTTGGAYFIGRPVLPRRYQVRFSVEF